MTHGLAEKGVRVTLVELAAGKRPMWIEGIPGASYFSLAAGSKIRYPAGMWRLARYLRAENVDVLHTHLYYPGLLGVAAKRLYPKTRVALMRHHTSIVRILGSRFHIFLDRWMAKRADHLLTVSIAARDFMQKVDGIRLEIDVVHLGFDFDRLRPDDAARQRLRAEFGFTDDDFVIGYVANLIEGKGHAQLIEAFQTIVAEIPSAKLLLVGSGKQTEVIDAINGPLAGNIVLTGWRNDVPACLNAMNVFVQPSLSEAFSQVIIEAMGTGLPVVATDVGGAREVIENGVNGILVEPGDVSAIAHEVIALFKNEGSKEAMARRGMADVRERFTARRMVDQQFTLYKRWIDAT